MKNFVLGFLSCLVIVAAIVIPRIWPPELTLIFNNLFWISVALFVLCCVLVGYLYASSSASRGSHFFFGLLLIISASVMYSGFEEIAANTAQWAPFMRRDHPNLFVLLPQAVAYTKSIIAFGLAALGANLAANSILIGAKRPVTESPPIKTAVPSTVPNNSSKRTRKKPRAA